MIDYRTLPRHHVLCLDMKSFFASCECVRRGSIRRKRTWPSSAIVHRSGSVVLAATPGSNKTYGIGTGKRLFDIPRHPFIHIVPPSMRYYLHQSMEVTRLLRRFVPEEAIHPYSIDEWWICIDGMEQLLGDAWTIARRIRAAIYQELGLPSSIGIGPNKFLAKVILDIEGKHTGLASCSYEEVAQKLWPQPVQRIWGIGPRLAKHLHQMGIRTLGHLAHTPRDILTKKFGVIGHQLYYHAWGIDLSPVMNTGPHATPKASATASPCCETTRSRRNPDHHSGIGGRSSATGPGSPHGRPHRPPGNRLQLQGTTPRLSQFPHHGTTHQRHPRPVPHVSGVVSDLLHRGNRPPRLRRLKPAVGRRTGTAGSV